MKEKELHESLEDLRKALHGIRSVDESSRTDLEDLMEQIADVLEIADPEPCEKHEGLLEKLRQSTGGLEAAHPDLSAVLQRAVDALANMGI
jgi:hypothetical protein